MWFDDIDIKTQHPELFASSPPKDRFERRPAAPRGHPLLARLRPWVIALIRRPSKRREQPRTS